MNAPAPDRQEPRHILPLDGLRGLAILLVITRHNFDFIPLFSFGWSGVDLFFVLSGYLITGRLLESLGRPGYFINFYRNRILRIFPIYYGTLILFFIGIHFFIKPATQPLIAFYLVHWKSFFCFTENWIFIRFGMPNAPYLLHFWSLAVEEQFYLLWPALIFLLPGIRSRLRLFALIALLVLAARCIVFWHDPSRQDPTFYYFNTFFRMDSFVIGALLSQLHFSKIVVPERLINLLFLSALIPVGLSHLVFGNMDNSNPFFVTIGYTLLALLFACLLHKSVRFPQSMTAKFFSAPILRFFGKISYGLYIFHFLFLEIFSQRFYDWGARHLTWGHLTGSPLPLQLFSGATCFLLSLLVSILSYRFFESWFLRLKKYSGK